MVQVLNTIIEFALAILLGFVTRNFYNDTLNNEYTHALLWCSIIKVLLGYALTIAQANFLKKVELTLVNHAVNQINENEASFRCEKYHHELIGINRRSVVDGFVAPIFFLLSDVTILLAFLVFTWVYYGGIALISIPLLTVLIINLYKKSRKKFQTILKDAKTSESEFAKGSESLYSLYRICNFNEQFENAKCEIMKLSAPYISYIFNQAKFVIGTRVSIESVIIVAIPLVLLFKSNGIIALGIFGFVGMRVFPIVMRSIVNFSQITIGYQIYKNFKDKINEATATNKINPISDKIILRKKGIVHLVGPSGIGKSTLLRQLYCELKNKNKKVSFVDSNYLWLPVEICTLRIDPAIFNELFDYNEWNILKNKKLSETSLGQNKRFKLILALMSKSDVYLLDEPLSNLDEINKQRALNFLNAMCKSANVVVVDHEYDGPGEIAYVSDIKAGDNYACIK